MSQALQGNSTPSFDVALADKLVNDIDSLASRMTVGGTSFVKFKKGDWVVGKAEDTFPENKFEAVPNLPQMKHGWVCWKDGQLVDEHWVTVGETLPEKSALPDHGPYAQSNDGWQENFRFDLKILATLGVPSEINGQFTGASKGAQSAIGAMMKQWVGDCKDGTAAGKVPVVMFSADHYKHSSYGKVNIPKMTVTRYIEQGEMSSSPEPEAPAPKTSKKKPNLE